MRCCKVSLCSVIGTSGCIVTGYETFAQSKLKAVKTLNQEVIYRRPSTQSVSGVSPRFNADAVVYSGLVAYGDGRCYSRLSLTQILYKNPCTQWAYTRLYCHCNMVSL